MGCFVTRSGLFRWWYEGYSTPYCRRSPFEGGFLGIVFGVFSGGLFGHLGAGVRVSRVVVELVYSIIWETSPRHLTLALVAAYYVGAEFILAGGHKF